MWQILKPLLFSGDAETAHHLVTRCLAQAPWLAPKVDPGLSLKLYGLSWRGKVGLAAGFDKDGTLLAPIARLGFGSIEVGTVTPKAQAGNPRPRLWRERESESLFNRMGFNNAGAEAVAKNVAHARDAGLPEHFRVGVSVGKNKDTPLESAAQDYVAAVKPFVGLVDYVAINVSSPNTPGLRHLQSPDALKDLVARVRGTVSAWNPVPPIVLKLAPEVTGVALTELESATRDLVEGYILTNTLAGERGAGQEQVTGGWSGGRVASHALESLKQMRRLTDKGLISCGGILSAADTSERLSLGADMVQIYAALVYRGPCVVRELTSDR